MKSIARGAFGLIILAAFFALVTWLCGEIILRRALTDPVIRWTVATAAAAVLGALVAKWAYSFAKVSDGDDVRTPRTGAGKTWNSIGKATILGPVTQGRDITGPAGTGGRHDGEAASDHDEAARTGSGSVKNSIADALVRGAVIQGRDISEATPAEPVPEESGSQEC